MYKPASDQINIGILPLHNRNLSTGWSADLETYNLQIFKKPHTASNIQV